MNGVDAESLGVEVFRRGKQVRDGRPDDLMKVGMYGTGADYIVQGEEEREGYVIYVCVPI